MNDDDIAEIFRGVKLKIGLRQQGHIPTVERMLAEGATWEEIGRAIGWHGPAVERWYYLDRAHQECISKEIDGELENGCE